MLTSIAIAMYGINILISLIIVVLSIDGIARISKFVYAKCSAIITLSAHIGIGFAYFIMELRWLILSFGTKIPLADDILWAALEWSLLYILIGHTKEMVRINLLDLQWRQEHKD